ncbi:PhoU domain-containing protein [Candidatus Omnitrophota bacterium]
MTEVIQDEVKKMSALQQEILEMLRLVQAMFTACFNGFIENDIDILKHVPAGELKVTKIYNSLTASAVELAKENLSAQAQNIVVELVDCICSAERIGDCCADLAERIEYKIVEGLLFSETAVQEYRDLHGQVQQILLDTIKAMQTHDQKVAEKCVKSKFVIDKLVDQYRASHIERSAKGICDEWAKVRYLDMLDSTKEVAQHCIEIAEKKGLYQAPGL